MAAGSYLSRIFSGSPLHELQQHMSTVAACSKQLTALFAAVTAEDRDEVEAAQQRVHRLENQADDIKKNVRMNLPRSLFLPVDRADLLELLGIQDHIANTAQDIAGVLVGRRMRLPPEMADGFNEFVASAVAAAGQAEQSVAELNELFESGFRGAEVEIMEAMIERLDQVERETDEIEVRVRGQLFAIEDKLGPVDVMFLYRIIDWIGDIADDAQRVGSRLQLLLDR